MSKLTWIMATSLLLVTQSAMASDLPSKKPIASPVKAPKAYSWDGIYIGASLGRASGNGAGNASDCSSIVNIQLSGDLIGDRCGNEDSVITRGDNDISIDHVLGDYYSADSIYWNYNLGRTDEAVYWNDGPGTGHIDDNHAQGLSLGGQMGLLKQSGAFVYGVEFGAKFLSGFQAHSWEGFNNDWYDEGSGGVTWSNYGGNFQVDTKRHLNWLTTLRGRIGVVVGDEGRIMPYITGGAALAVVSSNTTLPANGAGADGGSLATFTAPTGKTNFMQSGWVLGGGVEYALTDNVSLALEYQYVKLYGAQDHIVHYSGQYDAGNSFDIVHKVGFDDVRDVSLRLNYHF